MDKHTNRFGSIEFNNIPNNKELSRLLKVKKDLETALITAVNENKSNSKYMGALTDAIQSLNKVKKFM